jgi:hypothetical protein
VAGERFHATEFRRGCPVPPHPFVILMTVSFCADQGEMNTVDLETMHISP